MNVRERLVEAEAAARETGSDATGWDAKILLAHVVGHGKPLLLDPREEVPVDAASRFRTLWNRRLTGEPVQHLVGEWDFFGRPFFVDRRALVPRPETEILIAAALAAAPAARNVIDLGTGSGVLAVTWLAERASSRAVAVDASVEALVLAGDNARRHAVHERLELVAGDWTAALAPGVVFDLAVSNPPYLAASDASHLSPTVRDHDPARALFSGADGQEAIRGLLDDLPAHLAPGAFFLFEMGAGQSSGVEREIAARPLWRLDRIVPDLAGIPRVAVVQRT